MCWKCYFTLKSNGLKHYPTPHESHNPGPFIGLKNMRVIKYFAVNNVFSLWISLPPVNYNHVSQEGGCRLVLGQLGPRSTQIKKSAHCDDRAFSHSFISTVPFQLETAVFHFAFLERQMESIIHHWNIDLKCWVTFRCRCLYLYLSLSNENICKNSQ